MDTNETPDKTRSKSFKFNWEWSENGRRFFPQKMTQHITKPSCRPQAARIGHRLAPKLATCGPQDVRKPARSFVKTRDRGSQKMEGKKRTRRSQEKRGIVGKPTEDPRRREERVGKRNKRVQGDKSTGRRTWKNEETRQGRGRREGVEERREREKEETGDRGTGRVHTDRARQSRKPSFCIGVVDMDRPVHAWNVLLLLFVHMEMAGSYTSSSLSPTSACLIFVEKRWQGPPWRGSRSMTATPQSLGDLPGGSSSTTRSTPCCKLRSPPRGRGWKRGPLSKFLPNNGFVSSAATRSGTPGSASARSASADSASVRAASPGSASILGASSWLVYLQFPVFREELRGGVLEVFNLFFR